MEMSQNIGDAWPYLVLILKVHKHDNLKKHDMMYHFLGMDKNEDGIIQDLGRLARSSL